jgi:hypothetical protein
MNNNWNNWRLTPFGMLYEWAYSDNLDYQNAEWITEKIKSKYPGGYNVRWSADQERYIFVFDNVEEETLFLLKWGS